MEESYMVNEYLIAIGSQVSRIRDILGFNQIQLAEKIGVSRPIISNIEQDPTKISRNVALALFAVSFGELGILKNEFINMNYDSWENDEHKEELINSIIDKGLTKKIIGTSLIGASAVAGVLGVLIPVIPALGVLGGITSAALIGTTLGIFSNPSKAKKYVNIKKEHIKLLVDSSLVQMESQLCNCFLLQKADLVEFINKIDNRLNI